MTNLKKGQEPYTVPPWLLNSRFQVGFIVVVVLLTFFTGLGAQEPSLMEARNFITAREITQNNHWLVPTMNGYLRLAKPPLPTWLTALSGIAAGDIENLVALRLPAAIMAGFLILFFFALVRQLASDKLIPFFAALVLSSSFCIINIGRQGTWDVYCHSFMVGALWVLVLALQKPRQKLWLFALAGAMLGCSFLSKGPVAFYTLLLPFMVSYGYSYGAGNFKRSRAGLLLALLVCVAVSVAWPLYIYLTEPASLSLTVQNEGKAWVNRHVQPFWYYWMFPVQSGMWTVFALAALVLPIAKGRLPECGRYRFAMVWVLLTVVLLSLMPEKKERYLFPAMVPLALLTAHYLRHLLSGASTGNLGKWGYWVVLFNVCIYTLVAFALPVALYLFALQPGLISWPQLLLATVACVAVSVAMIRFVRHRRMAQLLLAMVAFHTVGVMLVIPYFEDALTPPFKSQELTAVRKEKQVAGLALYAVEGMNPKYIWEVGRPVDTLRVQHQHLVPPHELPVAVFSEEPLSSEALPSKEYVLKEIDSYYYNRKDRDKKFYLNLLMRSGSASASANNVEPVTHAQR